MASTIRPLGTDTKIATMSAESEAQQQAAGAALAVKRGESSPEELVGAATKMHESMTEEQLLELAETSHDGLPSKKS